MTPQQEFTLTNILIGALRGWIESLQSQSQELQPRAAAYYRTDLDARAVPKLRNIATANGSNPDWAESRYFHNIGRGYSEHLAFDDVVAELDA